MEGKSCNSLLFTTTNVHTIFKAYLSKLKTLRGFGFVLRSALLNIPETNNFTKEEHHEDFSK